MATRKNKTRVTSSRPASSVPRPPGSTEGRLRLSAEEAERILLASAEQARQIRERQERERGQRADALRLRLSEAGLGQVSAELVSIAVAAERAGRDPVEVLRQREQAAAAHEAKRQAAYDAAREHECRRLYRAARVPADCCGRAKIGEHDAVPEDVRPHYARAEVAIARLMEARGIQAMYGPPGTGKTWMACGLAWAFCAAGRAARYVPLPDYLATLRATYSIDATQTEIDREREYTRPDLLIIDEIDLIKDGEYADQMLSRLILARHRAEHSTILISNLTERAMLGRLAERVVDRMREGAGGVVCCEWRSLRGETQRPLMRITAGGTHGSDVAASA